MPANSDIIERPRGELAASRTELNVTALLEMAVNKDLDVTKLQALIVLAREEQDRHAAREFTAALAAFQQECPDIPRTSRADIATRSGARMQYNYAELDDILKIVRPVLALHGFGISWDAKVENNMLLSICWLRHVNGHKESATFSVPTATNAGMSEQQKIAAAGTFADRNSLVRVLGIRTTDQDNDGADDPGETITADQAMSLEARVDDVGGDKAAFLKFAGVGRFADIPAARLAALDQAVTAKERKARP